MTLEKLKTSLRLPVIASPLFILSNPRTVVAQCCAGSLVFPALNARGEGTLKQWLEEIKENWKKKGKQQVCSTICSKSNCSCIEF